MDFSALQWGAQQIKYPESILGIHEIRVFDNNINDHY
jgi:hypothetical protein